jgi:redox-sensitive bicupin YhaK (pirin superfamily)
MTADPVSLVITPRTRDLGGFSVRRALPDGRRRMVGPFIFFDHMGPADFPPGHGIDVRPHPHIALATVTFLFEGEILHRDSLGSQQAIRPGDVNWMLAGHGIVHSERTSDETRRRGGRLHGIQSWVALPKSQEETAPSFVHHPAASIPRIQRPGVDLRVVAGTAYGQRSPVGVLSPTLYVAATLDAGATLEVDAEHAERAAYVLDGTIAIGGREFSAGTMAVFQGGGDVQLRAVAPTRLVIVGGAALDGERHIWWNFVASSVEQMERAKQDWHVRNEARFPKVPGDEHEFIPLPEDPAQPIPSGQGNVTFNP